MSILRRFIRGAVFGITGISLLTLAAWTSPAQVVTGESGPKARMLAGRNAPPPQTGLQQQFARQPQPLSLEEKRRFFRSVINSLAEQSKLSPNSNSAQAFSPNLWNLDFNLAASAPTLTPGQPLIPNLAGIQFGGPRYVQRTSHVLSSPYVVYWGPGDANQTSDQYLALDLNTTKGKTYLLDFTVNTNGRPMQIGELSYSEQGVGAHMEIDVTQGHLLVPLLSERTGMYAVSVNCVNGDFTFYKVEINQLN